MKQLNRKTAHTRKPYPEKILQFGGGNFLRAFLDWMVDCYNNETLSDMGILVVSPMSINNYKKWQDQEGLYHVMTKGYQNGKTINEVALIKSISRVLHVQPDWNEYLHSAENRDIRFIFSNTTEAGIRFSDKDCFDDKPPKEFPAKLTIWLYHRFQFFKGAVDTGCIFIPVELIIDNGLVLKECILRYAELWTLSDDFKNWINEANTFCNTLVDRIVPGVLPDQKSEAYKQVGYEDAMITQGEAFHFCVIEGPDFVQNELPLNKVGLQVLFTNDLKPYRLRKVRILNGAHTSMVPVGVLYGLQTVKESVEHPVMGEFVRRVIFEEIIPTLDLPSTELNQFANDVLDRFRNPFIIHELMSISLNSISKFKTRVLPSILEYSKRNSELPKLLVFSMAALIHFYKGIFFDSSIILKDDPKVLAFLHDCWNEVINGDQTITDMTYRVMSWEYAWGQDLNKIQSFPELLVSYVLEIENEGAVKALNNVLK